MQLIAVDVGNSSIKVGVCESDPDITRIRLKDARDPAREIDFTDAPYFWSVCSVNNKRCRELQEWVAAHRPQDHFHLIQSNEIPIRTNVESREQVGRDRLVAAWAAIQMVDREQEIVVVDAGTAVTIDKIASDSVFQGGVIFPGADSCLRLLSKAAADLPNLSNDDESYEIANIMDSIVGKNTEMAILRGVFHSQLSAFVGLANTISMNAHVIATGGEIEAMQEYLPRSWQVESLLVLRGARNIGEALMKKLPSEY